MFPHDSNTLTNGLDGLANRLLERLRLPKNIAVSSILFVCYVSGFFASVKANIAQEMTRSMRHRYLCNENPAHIGVGG